MPSKQEQLAQAIATAIAAVMAKPAPKAPAPKPERRKRSNPPRNKFGEPVPLAHISASIPQSVYMKLKKQADSRRITLSLLIRESLAQAISQEPATAPAPRMVPLGQDSTSNEDMVAFFALLLEQYPNISRSKAIRAARDEGMKFGVERAFQCWEEAAIAHHNRSANGAST